MPRDPASTPILDYVLAHARVKVNVCSFQRHERGYLLNPRTVPDYNLIYVTRGRVVWVIEGQEYPLTAGGLVIVPPAAIHHAYSLTQAVTLGSVHVEVMLPGGQDVFDLLAPPRHQDVPRGCRLDGYLRGIMSEFSRDSAAATGLMMPGWAQLIVLELLRHDGRAGLLRPRELDPIVSELLQKLHDRAADPITLADLARWSGYSPQHLNRLFRRVLGLTPLQYLVRLRLEQAAALLGEGRLTIRAIARRIGFDDPYYFSRLFKQHFGRSPAQHRAAAGSDSPSPRSKPPSPARHDRR